MVIATKGSLITCDETVKELLLSFDAELPPNQRVIIDELDDRHLLVKEGKEEWLERRLRQYQDRIAYTQP